jgi:hypothetical protein
MKTVLSLLIAVLSTNALASLPIVGTWYNSYVERADGSFSPESLVQVNEDGTMKWEVLFPESTQKQIVIFKAVITANTVQTTSVASKTNCSDTSMEADPAVNPYIIVGSKLTIAGVAEFQRATDENIQKFAKVQEGCN